jgi:hypothetical protein
MAVVDIPADMHHQPCILWCFFCPLVGLFVPVGCHQQLGHSNGCFLVGQPFVVCGEGLFGCESCDVAMAGPASTS